MDPAHSASSTVAARAEPAGRKERDTHARGLSVTQVGGSQSPETMAIWLLTWRRRPCPSGAQGRSANLHEWFH